MLLRGALGGGELFKDASECRLQVKGGPLTFAVNNTYRVKVLAEVRYIISRVVGRAVRSTG